MTANSLIYNSYLKPQLVWVTVWRVFELDTFVKCYLIAHTASNFIYSGKKNETHLVVSGHWTVLRTLTK